MLNFKWPFHSLKNKSNEYNIEQCTNKNQKKYYNEKMIPSEKISNNPKNEVIKQSKIEQLNQLKINIENNANIKYKNLATNFVFNDGDINSKILFIGEAPGQEEDAQGIPFVGRSGKLLRFFLKEAEINNFYITNIVPWRPPNNQTPNLDEINIMKPYIMRHIEIINPTFIITVGTTALKTLGNNQTITSVQGTLIQYNNRFLFPIYHPSYALRVNIKKKELWYSILKLASIIRKM